MTRRAEWCFGHARQVAGLSDFGRVKIGCVVAQNGKVLSAGFNSRKTHPRQKAYNRYRAFEDAVSPLPAQLHAEIAALLPLRDSGVEWGKVELFIYRLRRDRPQGMAAPCPACRRYLKDLGVRSVWYTTDYGFAHEELT